MIVWVLVVQVLVTSPLGNKPMPYLAFESQQDCTVPNPAGVNGLP